MSHDDEPKTDKPHFSTTSLNMLARCPKQYELRYIDGLIQPPGVALTVGKATDQAVTADLQHKIDSGELLADEAVEEAARDALLLHWDADPPELDEAEKTVGVAKLRGEAVDQTVALARLHHDEIAPDLRPVAVQKAWRVEIPDSDRDALGFIDVVEATPAGGQAIRDTKTAGKSPSAGTADVSLQLTMYALASWAESKALPEYLTLDFLVKTKTPKAVVQTTRRAEDQLAALLERMALASAVVKAGVFMPTDPSNWWCSKKFCGYWASACPFGKRAVASVSFSNPEG